MANTNTPTLETGEEPVVTDQPVVEQVVEGADIENVAAQAENPDAVRKALQAEREAARKARKDADAMAARVKEFEDRDKSEQERMAEERDALKSELSPLKAENLRLRVAMEKNLPAELIDRLKGEDREALEADAEELLALVAKTTGARGSVDQGARGGGANQLTREALKTMSSAEIVKAQDEGRLDHLLKGSQA